MEQIRTIPKELLCLIPKFEGDGSLLNLFIKKAQYVFLAFSSDNASNAQKTYVFHAISSRLSGRAAILLSERDDINTWEKLQDILIQHFGDPRSEECIAIELEQIKIKNGESYIDLCHRIQHTRSTLFSKVNLLVDEGVKAAKMIVYNNLALNVFLFNLTEDLIRIVRLKGCTTLEAALSIVTEEINFLNQYQARNKMRQHPAPQTFRPQLPSNPALVFTPKFGIPQSNQNRFQMPAQNFKFGISQQQYTQQQQQPQGFRYAPQNQPAGFRFNPNSTPPQNFRFGIPRQQQNNLGNPPQGYRPPFQNNFNRPPPGFAPQQNFKFGIPNHPLQHSKPIQNTDVSMRTARPLQQNMLTDSTDALEPENMFYNNELVEPLPEQYYDINTESYTENYAYNLEMPEVQNYDNSGEAYYSEYSNPNTSENFYAQASSLHPK